MKRRNNQVRKQRGDGGWLAYGISGLFIITNLPAMMSLSQWIFDTFLYEYYWDAEFMKWPVFLCCLIIGFFGLSVALAFGTRLLLLCVLPLITGGRHEDA